jgi:hypothetical protein
MTLPFDQRKKAFIKLGNEIGRVLATDTPLSGAGSRLTDLIETVSRVNPWFTQQNVRSSLAGIQALLNPLAMEKWLSGYSFSDSVNSKTVAVIMAGNIPIVGFHDMMCVVLSGHKFLGKLSSQDTELPVKVAELLFETDPDLQPFISFNSHIIKDFDAVIATGSNNSSRYFDYYFGKYPHIIRKNRSSLAVISGNEGQAELEALADDIFMYFGMGCRNVSKLLLPQGYDIKILISAFSKWEHLMHHNKFFNNYEYQKAVMLVNRIEHLDNGFVLLKKDQGLSSPLAVIYYDYYSDIELVKEYAGLNKDNLQCIVAEQSLNSLLPGAVPPGKAQQPGPADYADGVDTLNFLLQL